MSGTTYSQQRRYRRAPVYCPLTLRRESGAERLTATNLNEGGLFVLSRRPPEEGQPLHLVLELPEGTMIEADGEVASATPEVGFGVRFTHIDPKARHSIACAVKSALDESNKYNHWQTAAPRPEEMATVRGEPRVRMVFEVEIEGEAFLQRGRVCDVSPRGVSVCVFRPYEIGQQVRFIGPRRRFTASAVVRNCVSYAGSWRVGLEILEAAGEWVMK